MADDHKAKDCRLQRLSADADQTSSSAIVHGASLPPEAARMRTKRAWRGGKSTTIRRRLGSSIAARIVRSSTAPLHAGLHSVPSSDVSTASAAGNNHE